MEWNCAHLYRSCDQHLLQRQSVSRFNRTKYHREFSAILDLRTNFDMPIARNDDRSNQTGCHAGTWMRASEVKGSDMHYDSRLLMLSELRQRIRDIWLNHFTRFKLILSSLLDPKYFVFSRKILCKGIHLRTHATYFFFTEYHSQPIHVSIIIPASLFISVFRCVDRKNGCEKRTLYRNIWLNCLFLFSLLVEGRVGRHNKYDSAPLSVRSPKHSSQQKARRLKGADAASRHATPCNQHHRRSSGSSVMRSR